MRRHKGSRWVVAKYATTKWNEPIVCKLFVDPLKIEADEAGTYVVSPSGRITKVVK